MISMRLRDLLAGPVLVGALLLAGCGASGGENTENLPKNAAAAGGLDALVKKAKEDGEVSLYAATTEKATSAWAKKFTEKYGIPVKLYRDGSTTLYQKWAQEVQGGVDNADIVIQNVQQLWEDAKDKGWVANYRTENYGAYDFDRILPESGLAGMVYPLHQSIGAVAWNTKITTPAQQALLRKDPVAALADPSFKGKIALGDTGGATTAGNYANIILHQKDKYGWDWLQGVADNDPALFESQIPIAEQLVKGARRAFFNAFLASLRTSPSRVITAFVHASASAAHPRLRMTKSSAYAMTCARNASPRPVSRQYFRNRFM